jgi:hypothetical protein
LETNQLAYCGVWDEGREYSRGSLVTFAGSMWHANQATRARPGVNAAWRLCVKRGRDGKDAK